MRNIKHVVAKTAIFASITLLVAIAAMYLWNAIIPSLTDWGTINYAQTLGLMILGRLFTGGAMPRPMRRGSRVGNIDKSAFEGLSKEDKIALLKEIHSAK